MDIATVASWLAYIVATLCSSPVPQQDVEADLAAAEAFYWAALADDSDPVLLELGSSRLEGLLAREDEVGERARALEADLRHQIDMAHDTLRGVFPAYRFLVEGPRNEAFVDDPWVLAAVRSARALVEAVENRGLSAGQYIVRSDFDLTGSADYPVQARAIENEFHAILANSSRLWLDPRPGASAEASSGKLVVAAESMGNARPLWGIWAEGRLTESGSGDESSVSAFGFAVDRRDRLPVAIGILIGSLVVGLLRQVRSASGQGAVHEKLAAGALAWGGGVALAAAAPRLAADWLAAPTEILASGLGSAAFVAFAAVSSIPVLLGLARLHLGDSLDPLIPHWKSPESGAWPAIIGGGSVLWSATVIEVDLLTTLPVAAAWVVVAWCACELLQRPDRLSVGAAVVVALGVVASTFAAAQEFELGGTAATQAVWFTLPPLALFGAWLIGPALFAYGIAGLATLGLMAAATTPLFLLALALLVAATPGFMRSRSRRSAGDGVSGASRDPECVAVYGLEASAKDRVDTWYQADERWSEIRIVGGTRGDRLALARALVRVWGLKGGEVQQLECSEGGGGGLHDIRTMVLERERIGSALMGAATSIVGGSAAGLPEQERLIDTLLNWFERGGPGIPKVILLVGCPSKELAEILNKAERMHRAKPKGRRVRVMAIPNETTENHASLISSVPSDLDVVELESSPGSFRQTLLEEAFLFDREFAAVVAHRADEGGLRLGELIQAIDLLEQRDVLKVDSRGIVPTPPEARKERVFGLVDEALLEAQANDGLTVASLSDDQRLLLRAAALQGATFDIRLIAALAGIEAHSAALKLESCGIQILDLERDGWMGFADSEDRASLLRELRVEHEAGKPRWSQVALDMLRAFVAYEAGRALETTPVSVEPLWSALRFSERACRHGGDVGRMRDLLSSLWTPLIEVAALPWRVPEDAEGILECALAQELVPSDLAPAIYALTLRIEEARRSRAYLASDERVESVERAASALLSEGWESDPGRRDAALEIACRWITLDMAEGSKNRVGSRELLDGVLAAEGASSAQKGRAHYEIARSESLAVKTKPDPSGRYPEALERFSTAARLLRDAGDLSILVRVLRTHAEALGIPPQGVDRASVEAREVLLDEALEITQSLGDERGLAMIEGTYGRLYQYEATLPENPLDPEARAQYLAQARHYFDLDLQRAKRLKDLDGVIHMTTSLAQVAWSAGQFDEARARHLEADELLTRTQGQDMGRSRAFALLGLLAEARRTNSIEERTRLEERLAACSPLPPLPYIEEYFRPHLDGVGSIWN